MKNNRVLVTGGAGFIGSELVHQLVASGYRVTVVDNLVHGTSKNLADIQDQVELVIADIRDAEAIGRLLPQIDIVFHLACLGVRHSIHSPQENHEVNATATMQLLRLARAADVPRFVYISSSEVYGTARWIPVSEDHPAMPMTVYGASKLAAEAYARAFYRTYGYPVVLVRPFNAYGPRCHHEGDSGEVIPKFMLRAMAGKPLVAFGDGNQTRDFTHVRDTARGIMLAGLSDQAVGETINIGHGSEISINDLAALIIKIVGRPNVSLEHHQPRPGDVLRLYADSSKAERLLGFKCQVGFEQGLCELRDWYKSKGESPESLLEQEIVHNWAIK